MKIPENNNNKENLEQMKNLEKAKGLDAKSGAGIKKESPGDNAKKPVQVTGIDKVFKVYDDVKNQVTDFYNASSIVFKNLLIDNKILDNLESHYGDIDPEDYADNPKKKEAAEFFSKNPRNSAYLTYYFVGAMFFNTAFKTIQSNVMEPIGEKIESIIKSFEESDEDAIHWSDAISQRFGSIKDAVSNFFTKDERAILENKIKKEAAKINADNFKISPTDNKTYWNAQMEAIMPYLLSNIIMSEGVSKQSYSDNGRSGYETIGAGFMIGQYNPTTPKQIENRKFRIAFLERVLGRKYISGMKISNEEVRKISIAWLTEQTLPNIKKEMKKEVSLRLFGELVVGAYNRGENIFNSGNSGRPIMDAVNSGKSEKKVGELFKHFFANRLGNFGGLPAKYGVSVAVINGHINHNDVLNAYANSVYKMNEKDFWNIKDSKNISLKHDTIISKSRDKLLAINNPTSINGQNQLQVRNYLTDENINDIEMGKLLNIEDMLWAKYSKDLYIDLSPENKSNILNNEGVAYYQAEDYAAAIDKFKEAIKENPKNYDAHGNITLAYIRADKHQDALDYISIYVKLSSVPNNIKANMYYNAMLVRKALGDNAKTDEEKLDHYKKAKQNLKLSEGLSGKKHQGSKSEIEEKVNQIKNKNKKQVSLGIESINKKMAFQSGKSQLNKRNNDIDNANNLKKNQIQQKTMG